jgi:hypothetical protein
MLNWGNSGDILLDSQVAAQIGYGVPGIPSFLSNSELERFSTITYFSDFL